MMPFTPFGVEEHMRLDKFTIKAQELIQQAQSLAGQHGNQQIEPEHLLHVMLKESEGIATGILLKLGVSPKTILPDIEQVVGRLPKISGAGDVYFSTATRHVMDAAFTEADKMKDASNEGLVIALAHGEIDTESQGVYFTIFNNPCEYPTICLTCSNARCVRSSSFFARPVSSW